MDFESIASANSAIRALAATCYLELFAKQDYFATFCIARIKAPTLATVKRSMIERKLRENGDELRRAREELAISAEQLLHLDDEAEGARIRALASETPLAEQESYEASRHADKMRRHFSELQTRINELNARQDELLDEMMAS